MADSKITSLASKAVPAVNDEFIINDVSGGNADKKVTFGSAVDIIAGDVNVDASAVSSIGSGVIVNADINASAAIANSKIVPFGIQQQYIKTGGLTYYGSSLCVSVSSTIALVTDVLKAYPFIVTKSFAIDRIQYEVTTAVAGNGICGIYNSKTDGTLYPDALLVAGTSQSIGSTGVKTDTISATLLADTLYWLAITSSSAATVRSVGSTTNTASVLGNTGTGGVTNQWNSGWSVARTYDATMPATFTASGTMILTLVPMILVRAT